MTTEEGLGRIAAAGRRMLSLDAPFSPWGDGAVSPGDLLADGTETPVPSRARARQIELAALAKLRAPALRARLAVYSKAG